MTNVVLVGREKGGGTSSGLFRERWCKQMDAMESFTVRMGDKAVVEMSRPRREREDKR